MELLQQMPPGSVGIVYQARNPKLNRVVALRQMQVPDWLDDADDLIKRILAEARSANGLAHANIAQMLTGGYKGFTVFVSAEFVEGKYLREHVNSATPGLPEVMVLARQLCAATDYAHGKQVVHYALNFGNIKVLPDGTLKLLDVTTLMKVPGKFGGFPQLLVMILTGTVGIALGLFISAVVKTSEMATSLVPLILIPQILFSGLVGVPVGISRVAGVVMPATWSFDEMKRWSGLDVLRGKDENAEPAGKNEGRGLYKQIEHENDSNILDTQQRINEYKSDAEKRSSDFENDTEQYQKALLKGESPTKPTAPKPGPAPEVAKATKIPDDLSGFVDFLHPWGGHWTNLGVLLTMIFVFLGSTGIALRTQDIG